MLGASVHPETGDVRHTSNVVGFSDTKIFDLSKKKEKKA